MTHTCTVSTPLGPLELTASERGLRSASFRPEAVAGSDWVVGDDEISVSEAALHLRAAARELDEYFAGSRHVFTVPLDPGGTDFQRRVWQILSTIPRGQTTTYGEIARIIGNPRGSQAVGLANGQNPLAIIVPCHRVVGANRKLTGYAGGIERKKWLLRHEAATLF